jgi:hypothetical protein
MRSIAEAHATSQKHLKQAKHPEISNFRPARIQCASQPKLQFGVFRASRPKEPFLSRASDMVPSQELCRKGIRDAGVACNFRSGAV